MKFHIGPLPENPEFQPEATGWKPLREPNPFLMQLFAVPVGFVAAGILWLLWQKFTPARLSSQDILFESVAVLLVLILVIPVHELIHAAVHPGYGRTAHSILGFWPKALLFYAHYMSLIRRTHFVIILLAPFLVLSVVPLLICALFQWNVPWLAFLSLWNALLACGDLFGVGVVMAQVPRAAWVCNQGYYTWWKPMAE